ncbi:hypothetical protein C7M61_002437 [Candidozyma pseudohaemuli]|uniref:ER transporter 6TM N-terminal domain-containing protein n=1 Tax=Candidozyma pseudohaemuli TaxID=418784 RepID=A0A2P7YT15_9ASCO|nr:hypothetical protein C7M61_002437 [[Candida] pseudohaemulonii]PSK39124.1 hypothetical protein C7M61_002437 [[Candida] pseudohaemulonii]
MTRSSESVREYLPQGLVADEKEDSDSSVYNVYHDTPPSAPLETAEPKPNFWRRLGKFFYPDWLLGHLTIRDVKMVLQTWVQVWTTVFLCIVPKTEKWFGQACYLFQILGFIMANGGFSSVINVTVALACCVYACCSWLVVTICSAITTHLRGWPTQEELIQELISDGVCSVDNAASCYLNEIIKGRYLETRCTVIWVFGCLFAFAFYGWTQKYHPLMRLPFVAGTLCVVIHTVTFVTWPTFVAGETNVLIRPMLLAFAFKIVCGLVVFPFTSSFAYLGAVASIHGSLAQTCEKNSRFFKSLKPSLDSFENHYQLGSDIQAIRVRLAPVEMFLISARWEISFSRFDPGDLAEIRSRIKPLITVLAGYKYFYELIQERKDIARNVWTQDKRRGSLSSQTYSSSHNKLVATFRQAYARVGVFENEVRRNKRKNILSMKTEESTINLHDLDVICDHMKEHYSEFHDEVPKTLKAISSWLATANEFRTYSIFKWTKHKQAQQEQHEILLQARDSLKQQVEKLQHANDYIQGLANELKGEEQRLCLVSQSAILLFFCQEIGDQMLRLCNVLLEIDEMAPTPRLITIFSKARHDKNVTVNHNIFDDPVNALSKKLTHRRDPDILDPENLFQIPGIMVTVTPVLVLGTSWADTRSDFASNIGVGWRPAVTRYISVVIGLSVAMLASAIPKPRSSKVAVRRIMSGLLEESSDMFCKISDFALKRLDNPNVHVKIRHDEVSDKMRNLLFSLANAKAMMGFIKYETAITGAWPAETFMTLQLLVNDVIQLYYLIYQLINQIEDTDEWIPIILDRAGWTNAGLVAEVLSLTSMSASALRRKTPLPKVTNANLSLRHFEVVSSQWGDGDVTFNERFYDDPEILEPIDEAVGEIRNRSGRNVNYQKLLSHDGRLNIVCLLVMHLVYKKIDEIVITVKSLVGEMYDVNDELFTLMKYEK